MGYENEEREFGQNTGLIIASESIKMSRLIYGLSDWQGLKCSLGKVRRG